MCRIRLYKAGGDGNGKGQKQQRQRKVDSSNRSFHTKQSSGNFRRNDDPKILRPGKNLAALLFIVVTIFINTSNCTAATHNIYIEKTPKNSGNVEPGTGLFEVQDHQRIKLIAVPKPGYRFLRWEGLGEDDRDLTENETDALIDSPMIIVAVFTREGSPTGRGTMLRPSRPLSVTGGSAPTFPDPSDDPHKKVPEPSTLILLTIGSLIVFRKRKRSA